MNHLITHPIVHVISNINSSNINSTHFLENNILQDITITKYESLV